MRREKLHVVRPENTGRPVVLVHGLGEHCRAGVYEWLSARLAERGVALWRFDLRGHGRSGGRKLSLDSWDDFHTDLNHVLDEVGKPAVVFGFSMGGLLALDHQLAFPDRHRATLAMAPPLGEPSIPRLLFHLAWGLNKVAPHFVVRSPWLPKFSRFPSPELDSYRKDRLIQCAVTSRLATELLESSRRVRRVDSLPKPVLLLHGERDQVCPPLATEQFARRTGATLRSYPNARHHLLLESCRDTLASDVADWTTALS